MLKILVPISFLTVLLDYSGWINKIDFLLEPAMDMVNLPPMAALPLIVGMLTGIYGGIAAMIMLPFSTDQMTLMAIFLLISHNLVQEGIIQGKSGMNPLMATICRLAASAVTVIIVAQFLNPESAASAATSASFSNARSLMVMLKTWGIQTTYLSIKIFVIVMTLMMLLGIMKSFNLIQRIVSALNPVLRIFGLDRSVGILWLTASVFGLAYGAAVIIEEAKEGHLTSEELTKLHLSIGINHSLVEDPALFLSLGISPFWLWIPRIITAILAVHLLGLWQLIKNRRKSLGLVQEPVK